MFFFSRPAPWALNCKALLASFVGSDVSISRPLTPPSSRPSVPRQSYVSFTLTITETLYRFIYILNYFNNGSDTHLVVFSFDNLHIWWWTWIVYKLRYPSSSPSLHPSMNVSCDAAAKNCNRKQAERAKHLPLIIFGEVMGQWEQNQVVKRSQTTLK